MFPQIMGVVNVTPDSFSDGGCYADRASAVAHGQELVAEGADLVDVGGESTRPGAEPVPVDEELRRVVPVIEALAGDVRVSVDTTKPRVAAEAVAAGATLVNDVSGSPAMAEVAATHGVGWICMHSRGTPRDMTRRTAYDDVVGEVRDVLAARAARGRDLGVQEVWIDPGIGFAKTAAQNLTLLRHLPELVATGFPVVVGTSRKSFLGAMLGRSDGAQGPTPVDDRYEGSITTATWAMLQGAAMVRVHEVRATVHAALVVAGRIGEIGDRTPDAGRIGRIGDRTPEAGRHATAPLTVAGTATGAEQA